MAKAKKLSSKDEVVEHVEKLLARKLQIKAQLDEIENAINIFILQMEAAPKSISKAKALRESDAVYKKEMAKLERREVELRGELFEIAALTRSIPVRRLKPQINESRVRELVLNAGLSGIHRKLEESLRASGCMTACETCVTSCNSECVACTECVTSCTTECTTGCTSDCVSCPTECVTLCTVGCPTMETYSTRTGTRYTMPHSLNQPDYAIQENALLETVARKYGSPDRIEIDWS